MPKYTVQQYIAQAPLFLGLTSRELKEIVQQHAFSLKHHNKGSVIAAADNLCNEIIIVVGGWIQTETASFNHNYRMVEMIQAPLLIEPDKLFGMTHSYRSSFQALTACESVTIPKESMLKLFEENLIIRLNMLNILCRKAQMLEKNTWQDNPEDLCGAIAQYIRRHALYPAGKKTLYIKMTQLASELNVSRTEVSKSLNEMADKERIILKRGIIEVPALQIL